MMMQKYFYYIILILLISCETAVPEKKEAVLFQEEQFNFPYNFETIISKIKLDKTLKEVSGLALMDNNHVLAIQDEKGIIYKIDLQNNKVEQKFNFAKKGDFEAVALVDSTVWVAKSNGKLYKVTLEKDNIKTIKIIKTPFHKKNNLEGLCYDKANNSLLIACKGNPFFEEGKNNKDFKAIYRFDLTKDSLIEKPFLLIDLMELKEKQHLGKASKAGIKILRKMNENEGDPTFQPSAIAIHPFSKNMYLLSAVGKQLLVLSPKGKMLFWQELDKKTHPQPEGICFAPNGDLYIADEGKKHKGTIHKYAYAKK